ncbi:hypothetical protein RJT34_21944 [Clitoria ternatea]|uniref:TIR domain-containing protein n=1 Tax=Clitoria ternatea TaxID=43366 RepID=A0AAN9IUU1_CLITE
MASSSSSSGHHWIHDVFINFRGTDTRESFVSHLYAALRNAGVNTFFDDEKLEKGAELGSNLLQAIEGSHISIVVFSKSYTESSWCLKELVEIMECRKTHGQIVVPIFYHIDPSDIRHQKGAFGQALEALASKIHLGKGVKQSIISKWRTALTQASNLSGWDLTTSRFLIN